MRGDRLLFPCLPLIVVMVVGCCGTTQLTSPVVEVPDDQLVLETRTWVNQLGLAQTDPSVWRPRLERACTEGVWDRQVAIRLAEEFIDEDLAVSVRDENLGPPSVDVGVQALWMMAVNVCRDAFPEGEIEKGPP